MPQYVDGYVLTIPKKNVAAYKRMARMGEKLWRKHGALEYRECVGEDLAPKFGVSFRKMMKAKPSETIVFAWIVYKSRAHRDRVNARIMKDPAMNMDMKDLPFDMKRMVVGGFEVLVGG